MSLLNIAVDTGITSLVWGFPIILFALFLAPFLFFRFILKKRLTASYIVLSILIGAALVAAALVAAYWGVVYLQGLAFCDLHGC